MQIPNLSQSLASVLVVVSCVLFGLVPWFAKSLIEEGLSPYAVAFFRYSAVALLLLPWVNFTAAKRRATLWALLGGLSVGLGWIGYVGALAYVPVSTLGVLYMTYPLFTMLFAWLWLRKPPSWQAVCAGCLVMLAAFLALSPAQLSPEAMRAVLLAFVAPVTFGFCIIVLTEKLNDLNIFERMSGNALGAMLGISPLLIHLPTEALLPSSTWAWMLLGGIAMLTAFLPQITYGLSAPRLGSSRVAVLGSVELVTMLVIGWGAYGEAIETGQVVAVAMVLFSMWLGSQQTQAYVPHKGPKLRLYRA